MLGGLWGCGCLAHRFQNIPNSYHLAAGWTSCASVVDTMLCAVWGRSKNGQLLPHLPWEASRLL